MRAIVVALTLTAQAAVAHADNHTAACTKACGRDAKAVTACVAMAQQYRGRIVVDTE